MYLCKCVYIYAKKKKTKTKFFKPDFNRLKFETEIIKRVC